jgi:RNA polymerase sigma factor (sigma-70 family)
MSGSEYHLEAKWVEKIREGDSESLRKLYKDNYPSIAHFVLNNNGTDTEAKDVYQESIIVFYEKIQNPDFELSCLVKTFLYSVARRLWLKRLSEKNRYVGKITDYEDFTDFSEAETEDVDESEKKFKQMEQALTQIGEPCQTILRDFYINKYSMQEIAEKMGYTGTDNAKTQKYKCLQRLKKLFFKEYGS